MEIVKITDIEVLIRLRFDYFLQDGHMPEGDNRLLEESLRSYFERRLGHDFVALGVRERDEIVSVGYLVIHEMPANAYAPTGLTGTLLNVLTYPPYRGKGYGKALIQAIHVEARERGLAFIDLFATEMGIPLYEKTGFLPIEYQAMRLKL